MKKIIAMVLLLTTMLFGADVKWMDDFKLALEASKKQHKPIIFIATKDGCKYCTMLKTTTLKDKDVVQKINKDFIPLKMNLSHSDALVPYMLAVYTRGFPTIWFLNEEGKALFEPIGGFIEAKDMKNALKIVNEAYHNPKMIKGAKK